MIDGTDEAIYHLGDSSSEGERDNISSRPNHVFGTIFHEFHAKFYRFHQILVIFHGFFPDI